MSMPPQKRINRSMALSPFGPDAEVPRNHRRKGGDFPLAADSLECCVAAKRRHSGSQGTQHI
jgi:hypothetical protein